MKTIAMLITILSISTMVAAQDVDYLGDQPGVHPCSKLITLMNRAHKAKDEGVSQSDIKYKVLKGDPMADEAIGVADMPGNFTMNAFNEQVKCEKKYHLSK